MTSPAGEKMSTKIATFCDDDCRANPNGCSYCGREGLAVGVRVYGEIRTLSGSWLPAFRECLSVKGADQRPAWGLYLAAAPYRSVRGASAIRSFRPL